MYKQLKGKKLLILAASVNIIDLVIRAKVLGVYTIVTDYNTDLRKSPAKMVADEYWNISWSDIDALEQKCKEEHIDGVTTGYSEFTVECLIKLCQRLELPCYCTQGQFNITRNKELFKKECQKNNVPVVREYNGIDNVQRYPIIVKPVDRGGSIGISVATSRESLIKAYNYAMDMSVCKKVIIEDFITQGTKFDAYYAITDGTITLLSTSDTINAANNGYEKVIQSAWLFPSKYQETFKSKIDGNLRSMIKNMGITNGFMFFSGFVNNGDFVFFETGFRLSGSHMYKYIEAKGLPNIQDIFIVHALTGSVESISFESDHGQDLLKCVILNYYAKDGVLAKLDGLDNIKKNVKCGLALAMCNIGEKCSSDKAILTKLGMVHLYGKQVEVLEKNIAFVNSCFVAEDTDGNDIVYDRILPSIVSNWWL